MRMLRVAVVRCCSVVVLRCGSEKGVLHLAERNQVKEKLI